MESKLLLPTASLLYLEGERGTAVFSKDRAYRYILTRKLSPTGIPRRITWVMLNPSVADHETDDMTIVKCMGFAKALGYDEMAVVNLFALVSTDPRALLAHQDPIGKHNEPFVGYGVHGCERVVAAWGALSNELWVKAAEVRRYLYERAPKPIQCLGRTKSGAPRHPSRLAYATTMEEWR